MRIDVGTDEVSVVGFTVQVIKTLNADPIAN